MNEKVYQYIFDELSKYLTAGWEKLVVYLEYGNASYSYSFYVKSKEGYVKCYDLADVIEEDLMSTFEKIDEFILKERGEEGDLWSNMTMIVDCFGRMHADFDYTDLSKGNYQYKKEWKKKYLV